MINLPFVSIIVPTYNRKIFLNECIKSLINQNYPKEKYEIIVVDDGSTDGTENVIKELENSSPCRLMYFKQNNQGPASVRNLGIKNARGSIIAFMDDDAVAPEDWLEKGVNIFYEREDIAILGGPAFYPPNLKSSAITKYIDVKDNYVRNSSDAGYLRTMNLFVKKEVFNKVGLFDVNFKTSGGEDNEWSKRVRSEGYKLFFFSNLIIYHNHLNSVTKRLKLMYKYGSQEPLVHQKLENSNTKCGCMSIISTRASIVLLVFILVLELFLWASGSYKYIPLLSVLIFFPFMRILYRLIFVFPRQISDPKNFIIYSFIFISEDVAFTLGFLLKGSKR